MKIHESDIKILGVRIDRVTMNDAVLRIDEYIKSRRAHYVVTPNPEIIMTAIKNPEYLNTLNNANLALPDGTGIIWAGKMSSLNIDKYPLLIKIPIVIINALIYLIALVIWPKKVYTIFPERVTGSDLIWHIASLASKNKYSVYFLGGMPGIAQKTADILKKYYPTLKVAGAYAGYPGENNLADRIRVARPDILFVAYGSPKQEIFIANNLLKLSTPVAIGIGGAFDFIAGKRPRSPLALRKIGFEWFWRFIHEPKRAKRIFKAFPLFVMATIKWLIHNKKES